MLLQVALRKQIFMQILGTQNVGKTFITSCQPRKIVIMCINYNNFPFVEMTILHLIELFLF